MSGSTKQSKAKLEASQQVWDAYPHKLLLYVMDAKDVAAKDSNGKSDPYVVIEHGQYKKQTKIIDKTLNPVWNELFFIQADVSVALRLEMWDHDKIGSPDYMGHVSIDLKALPQDRAIDLFPALQPRSSKKKEAVSGMMHLRLYQSSAKETRPPYDHYSVVPDLDAVYFYRPYVLAFKPGDLIGYSGHGIVSAVQKVLTGSPITSVGLVVYLPNKWTSEVEPYVLELTRNVNKNMDVFLDNNHRSGFYLFHLFERLHQFHGTDIVHFPLIHSLPPDVYKKVIEKVWDCHKRNGYLSDPNTDSYKYGIYINSLNSFIRKKKNWNFAKSEKLVEASSFDFISRVFREIGALSSDFQDPADILTKSKLYWPPVLLRGSQAAGNDPLYFNNAVVVPPSNLPSASPNTTLRGTPVQHSPTPRQSLPSHPSIATMPPTPSNVIYANPSYNPSLAPPTAPHRPPSPNPSRSITLSHLEGELLLSLLDGVVVDNRLVVSKDEFRRKMIEKGMTSFRDEAKFNAFYAALDSDHDGRVDLRELVCGFALLIDGSVDEKLISAFKAFDQDGDKFITKSELKVLLSILMKAANGNTQSTVVDDFVTQIFTEYDKNYDGKLSVEEFMNAAHKNSAVGNLFLTVSSYHQIY